MYFKFPMVAGVPAQQPVMQSGDSSCIRVPAQRRVPISNQRSSLFSWLNFYDWKFQ